MNNDLTFTKPLNRYVLMGKCLVFSLNSEVKLKKKTADVKLWEEKARPLGDINRIRNTKTRCVAGKNPLVYN